MNQNRLFVGNLSYQTMQPDLEEYFSQAGAVTSLNLMLDKVTGKSRGFAFVEFATDAEAAKAIEQFHNQEFQGRALTVNVARPRGGARAPLGRRAAGCRRSPCRGVGIYRDWCSGGLGPHFRDDNFEGSMGLTPKRRSPSLEKNLIYG